VFKKSIILIPKKARRVNASVVFYKNKMGKAHIKRGFQKIMHHKKGRLLVRLGIS
jgi:hypothetical protein